MGYADLMTSIKTSLESVDEIAKVYNYPASKLEEFPAAVFWPSSHISGFLTTKEDEISYQFRIWIIVATKTKGIQTVINDVLAPAVDAVIQQFANDWNRDNNPRTWGILESGDWSISEEQDGNQVFAELLFTVKSLIELT